MPPDKQLTAQVAAEVPVSHRGKRFKRTLHNSLRADVDQLPAVSGRTSSDPCVRVRGSVPSWPSGRPDRVRNQNSRRVFVCAKDADGFADWTNKVSSFSSS